MSNIQSRRFIAKGDPIKLFETTKGEYSRLLGIIEGDIKMVEEDAYLEVVKVLQKSKCSCNDFKKRLMDNILNENRFCLRCSTLMSLGELRYLK